MKKRSLTLAELIVMIIFFASPGSTGHGARRSVCSNNLKQIFNCMAMYGNEYNGAFPMIPLGTGHVIGADISVKNPKPGQLEDPFKDFNPGENHSVSQNLWLLVCDGAAQPELFICPSSEEQAEQKVNLKDGPNIGAEYFADFPWNENGGVMSYSFIQPWSRFSGKHSGKELWNTDAPEGFVLGADANNGPQPDFRKDNSPPDPWDLKTYVNSRNHAGDGQNVLYGDGHVSWSQTAYCGAGEDNIYTARPAGKAGAMGQPAEILSVRPQDPFVPKLKKTTDWDTVLVPNKEADLAGWNRRP